MEARGKVNCYVCKDCRKQILTINLNCGTTPFGIVCPYCKGFDCLSCFYRIPTVKEVNVNYGWYRPTVEEFKTLDKANQEHVLNGGLLKKELSQISSYLKDNIQSTISHNDWKKFAETTYVR